VLDLPPQGLQTKLLFVVSLPGSIKLIPLLLDHRNAKSSLC
jgi:hypothetical protein